MHKYLFFITLLSLLLSNHIPSTYSQCIETPLFGNLRYQNCPSVDEVSKGSINDKAKGISSSLVDDNNNNNNNNMIQILFNCDKSATPELCNKANIAFNNAATIVSNTFDLKVPLIVNASFVQLCGAFVKCLAGQPSPLGAAAPSRFMPLNDDDGIVRLYPQALVKQFQLPKHPQFAPIDINAVFNSNSSTFWFRGDPPIGKDQVDFEIVLVHEFLHGLGFVNSWDDYINLDNPSSLTPNPSFLFVNPEDSDVKNGTITFTGFQEYILDKFLVLTKDNSSTTLITNKLNQFTPISTNFTDEKDFITAFTKSPQYIETTNMFQNSITRGTLAIRLPDNGDNVLLETSLVPYKPGSTLSHVDFNTFSNTTDFLMRFKAPRQAILDDLTTINGNDPNYTNPIGPKTIRILQALGYKVKENAATFKITDQSSNNQPAQNSTKPAVPNNLQSASNASSFTTNISLLLSFFITILLL